MVTASSKSAKVPVLLAGAFSAALTAAVSADTVGATSVKDTPNEVTAVLPSALVAVMVPESGASSAPGPLQRRVPLWLPDWLTVPLEALMVTGSSKSAKVPVLLAG